MIKYTFGTTDLLGKGSNRVCFDIGGNNYRMICKIAFGEKKSATCLFVGSAHTRNMMIFALRMNNTK